MELPPCIFESHFNIIPPIYVYLFKMVSFLQVSPQKPCMHFSSPHTKPHASPISCSIIYDSNNILWELTIMKLPNMYFSSTSITPKNTAKFQAHISVMTATDKDSSVHYTDSIVLRPHRQIQASFCTVVMYTVSPAVDLPNYHNTIRQA